MLVVGVLATYAFDGQALRWSVADLFRLVDQLPDGFWDPQTEGDSFANLCINRGGEMWTRDAEEMDLLAALAVGAGLARWSEAEHLFPAAVPNLLLLPVSADSGNLGQTV